METILIDNPSALRTSSLILGKEKIDLGDNQAPPLFLGEAERGNLSKIIYFLTFFISSIPFIVNANVDDIDFSNDAGLPTFNEGDGFIKYETPYYFALLIIRRLIEFVGIFAIIAVMIGGIMYLTSLGVEDKVKKAKNVITYSIVGVLVSILSYALVDIVNNLTLK